jgi:hypothetical protein
LSTGLFYVLFFNELFSLVELNLVVDQQEVENKLNNNVDIEF